MECQLAEVSFFERFVAGFVRSKSGEVLSFFGPERDLVQSAWERVRDQLSPSCNPSRHVSPSQLALQGPTTVKIDAHTDGSELPCNTREIRIYEKISSAGVIIAIALDAISSPADAECEAFFAYLVLQAMRIDFRNDNRNANQAYHDDDIIDAIIEHFNVFLRYIAKDDKWEHGGREHFREKIAHFVTRGQRIEFCLPAFPCKSSHPGKAHGVSPDRGEYIALTHLNDFIEGIGRLYRPGAKLWVVSDGHVFSDCIGVDDSVVDDYGQQLRALSEKITMSRACIDRIGFKSLLDLFDIDNLEETQLLKSSIPALQHHIATQITEEAELCRRILQQGFQADPQVLRSRINSKEPGILALYRGFSRFMLEDLTLNPYTKALSQSQRRKLSTKVAFEMIQRNQAYSNLIEVVFPHHVRLSIHAHNNSGPKFGIQLFEKRRVLATNDLSPEGMLVKSHDELHVPTPWHNCIVEIQGHPTLYITKSSVAQAALSSGAMRGDWASHHDEGGCFYLEPNL